MAWYETQLIGVLVGGFLTFVSVEGRKRLEEKRTANRLMAAIRAEMSAHQDFLDGGHRQLKTIKREFAVTTLLTTTYAFVGDFRLCFIDANMDNLGILPEALLTKVIYYRGVLSALGDATKILHQTMAKNLGMAIEPNHIMHSQLNNGIATYEALMKSNKEIVMKIDMLS